MSRVRPDLSRLQARAREVGGAGAGQGEVHQQRLPSRARMQSIHRPGSPPRRLRSRGGGAPCARERQGRGDGRLVVRQSAGDEPANREECRGHRRPSRGLRCPLCRHARIGEGGHRARRAAENRRHAHLLHERHAPSRAACGVLRRRHGLAIEAGRRRTIMAAAIETDNLTKDFQVAFWRRRPYRALDGLSLAVEPGEVFGFLGPNGAGKSTTLKLLMQLIYPTAGSASILGEPAGDVAVRRRIGFLAENPYYYDYLTAEEVLAYFARLFGYSGADVRTRVARVLDEVGMAGQRRMRLRQLSKGLLQRVGLAQALINDPEVVFLDEPMSGLDPLGRRQVRDLILKLRERGCTVFFSSHILSDAETLCSRVGIMAEGRMVASGRVSDLVAFELKGWELVVADLSDEAARSLAAR